MMNSYLKLYFAVLVTIILAIGSFNLLIDPLWYRNGNQITGINLPWNERISKTNLFLQNPKAYDCLLLGTSRTTLLNSSYLQNNRCFNYAFSGGKLEELVNYAEYIKQKGFNPVKVYIEIEPASFNRRSKVQSFEKVKDPMPLYQAYFFSLDTFWLSFRSLFNLYDYARLYDRDFQVKLADDIPRYQPELEVENADHKGCDPDRSQFYQRLKQTFADASIVGFVAPVSVWRVYNTQYANGLLDCQLSELHALSQSFDRIYDFSVPSAMTEKTDNTYDGNHYYPAVFRKVAAVLEGRRSGFGIEVGQYSLADYKALYARTMQEFLARVDQRLGQG